MMETNENGCHWFKYLQNDKIMCCAVVTLHSTQIVPGWVIRSLIPLNWVLNHFYGLLGVLKDQILCLDLFLDQFWAKFGLRRPKNGQNLFFKIVDFLMLLLVL